MAKQVGYDEVDNPADFVKMIVTHGDCDTVFRFLSEENMDIDELPEDIKLACTTGAAVGEITMWSTIRDKVMTAYNKEKILYQTKKKLEYEFKASEQYWDGVAPEVGRATFDLMVDLNLIEIVLFGKEAEWVDPNDVFKFPTDEDKDEESDDAETGGLPSPEEEEGQITEEEPEEEGVTGEQTETEGEEPICVPADDPNADTGDNAGEKPKENCGNGILEELLGEQCDDGNNKSGDGCSQYCMKEETGSSLMCQDPEAVTFGAGTTGSGVTGITGDGEAENGGTEEEPDCPPGQLPKKDVDISGPPPSDIPDEYPQSENYPGPDIGGTMKEFPESKKPNCPEGYSPYLAQEGGWGASAGGSGETVGIDIAGQTFETKCIPTEFCASFDDVRSELFGSDWQEDEEKSKAAAAIEALFCVELIKGNRPESPYQTNDGCIDCHLAAITDALSKALETNVTPMQNTTAGFSLATRWGPNFSFNLTTAVKSKIQLALTADQEEEANEKEATKSTEEYIASEQVLYQRLRTLLIQMGDSFLNINNNFAALAGDDSNPGAALNLKKKNVCEK